MFGLGIWEFVIVVVVGLLVLGPRKLPEVARQIGKLMREFRRASHELRRGLDEVPSDPLDLARPTYSKAPKAPSLTELGIETSPLPGTVPQEGEDKAAKTDAAIGPPLAEPKGAEAGSAEVPEAGSTDEPEAGSEEEK